MNKKQQDRYNRLLPEGKPKYVRCYDNNGKTADRYTVVFTGRIPGRLIGEQFGLAMSNNPFHPQGIGQHFEYGYRIDYPGYSHLGKKIKFDDLPKDCQTLVLSDYVDYWKLKEHPLYSEY